MAGADEKIEILRHAMTPKTDAEGRPLSKIVPYQPIKEPCLLCPAKCCKLMVKVCVGDAIHYCRTLGLPFFAGIMMVPTADERRTFLLDRDPRIVRENEAWPGRVELQLRRQDNGFCHGLVDIGGYERCGIYDARPTFCRTYPVSWSGETAQGGPPAVMCPVPYAITPPVEQAFLADNRRQIDLWTMHDEIARAWNQSDRPRTIEALLEMIVPMAATKLGLGTDGIITLGDPAQRLYDVMTEAKVVARSPFEATVHAPRIYAGLAGTAKTRR
jgi:Fe-S-cluster containining protein